MNVNFIYHKPKCYVLRVLCFVFLFFIVSLSFLFFNNSVARADEDTADKCGQEFENCMYICPVESDNVACQDRCSEELERCGNAQETQETPVTDNGTGQDDTAMKKLENLAEKGIGMGIFSTPKQLGSELVLPAYLGTLVFGAMTILGVIFFGLVVYGGFLWLYAGGNDEQVTKAKKIITRAVIGLLVVIFAGAITQFIMYYGAR